MCPPPLLWALLLLPAWLVSATPTEPATPPAEPAAPSRLTAADLVERVRAALVDALGLQAELRLELTRTWEPPPGTPGTARLVLLDYPGDLQQAQFVVRLALETEAGRIGAWNLPFRAELWRTTWYPNQPLERGASLHPADFTMRLCDSLRERDAVPTDADLTLFTSTRPLQPGRPLLWRDVSRRVLVERGALVDVLVRRGGLLITLKAEALQSGSRGDRITLRNGSSRRNFHALVTDENTAEVEL